LEFGLAKKNVSASPNRLQVENISMSASQHLHETPAKPVSIDLNIPPFASCQDLSSGVRPITNKSNNVPYAPARQKPKRHHECQLSTQAKAGEQYLHV